MEINWKLFHELGVKSTMEVVNGFFHFMNMPNYVQVNLPRNLNNSISTATQLAELIYDKKVDAETYASGYNLLAEYFDWDGNKLVMIEGDSMTRYAIDNLQSDEEKAIEYLEENYPELLIED